MTLKSQIWEISLQTHDHYAHQTSPHETDSIASPCALHINDGLFAHSIYSSADPHWRQLKTKNMNKWAYFGKRHDRNPKCGFVLAALLVNTAML